MKYTVHYMLRANETTVLRALLKDQIKSFNSFKEAVDFIRSLKNNDKLVGEPVLGV